MKLKIDHASPVPLHAQVESLLRDLIELPEYKAGKLLPKEIELANRLGISRNTLRQATNKLENEGLLIRKKGVGTKVAQKNLTTELNQWASFTQEMNSLGHSFRNIELKAEWVYPENSIHDFFELKDPQKILRLSRLRADNEGPLVFFISYFHPRIGIKESDDFNIPLYELMENKYATPVVLSKERIKALKAPEMILKKLNLKMGSPVLFRERFVYDPGNRPVEYNIGYYHFERFTYAIDIRKN